MLAKYVIAGKADGRYLASIAGGSDLLNRWAMTSRHPTHELELTMDTTQQPPPRASTGDVWQELIDDEPDETLAEWFAHRRVLGIARYGVPLQRDNGRDPRRDLREELLDALAYAQQCDLTAVVGLLRGLLLADAAGALDVLSAPRTGAAGVEGAAGAPNTAGPSNTARAEPDLERAETADAVNSPDVAATLRALLDTFRWAAARFAAAAALLMLITVVCTENC